MTVPVKILAIMPGGMAGVEETGCIGKVVQDRGADLHWSFRLKGDALPEQTKQFDGLIVFGGEIGAHDPRYADYFDGLFRTIRAFHEDEKPVFGSCLGAQSIACALGGGAMPQGFFEFGFTELRVKPEAASDALLHDTPDSIPLFEMHNDTLALPPGAVHLMHGDNIPNQVYRMGAKTYGFQCHFEAEREVVDIWLRRELSSETGHSEAEIADMAARMDREFAQFDAAQRAFGERVMNRWMDLF